MMAYQTDTTKETLEIREHMQFRVELVTSKDQLKYWHDHFFLLNGGMSAEWIVKSAGECELYMCYFEYDGEPCIAVPFYIQGEVGMAQGIVRFKYTCPLPRATGPIGVFLLAAVCDHFMRDPSYRLKWFFVSPISKFRGMVLDFFKEHRVHFCDLGTSYFSREHCKYPFQDSWLQYHSEDPGDRYPTVRIITKPPQNDYQKRYMTWDSFDWPVETFSLGYINEGVLINEDLVWNVLEQRWEKNYYQDPEFNPNVGRYGEIVRRMREKIPYNFLCHIHGNGILLVDAKSLAWFASFPYHSPL